MSQQLLLIVVVVVVIFLLLSMNKKDGYTYNGVDIDRSDLSRRCRLCLAREDDPKKCATSCLELDLNNDKCSDCMMFSENTKNCIPACVKPT